MEDALNWLTGEKENGQPINPLYKNVKIDRQTLANLPEHGVLSDVTRVECGDSRIENEDVGIDTGPVNFEDDEKFITHKLKWVALFQQMLTPKEKKKKSVKNFLMRHSNTTGILAMSR